MTEKSTKIADALSHLNPSNDEHWTGQGLARLDAVTALVGEDVTRKEVEDVAPGFKREDVTVQGSQEPSESPDEPEAAPESPKEPDGATVPKIEAEIAKEEAKIAACRDRINNLKAKLDAILSDQTPAHTSKQNQEAIMAYIAQQNAQRAARAEARQEAINTGVRPGAFTVKSPLDQRLGSRSQGRVRGTKGTK